jgi:hypothetical protein
MLKRWRQTSEPLNPAEASRFQGHRGGQISMHRALAHFRLGPMNVAASLALLVFFSAIWLSVLPRVCEFWKRVLAWGVLVLPLHARIDVAERQFGFLHLKIPYLRLAAILPTLGVWSLTCFVTLLLYAATYLMPKNLTPVAYLSRGILIIQGSALVYFALWPIRFPHTPDQYMESLVTAMLALISVVPSLYALTYYIFDFGLWKKALLTLMTMVYLALFLPPQLLLQALVLQTTVLFMPVLYIVCGMLMNVLLIIAFYSWGMTWSFRTARAAIR